MLISNDKMGCYFHKIPNVNDRNVVFTNKKLLKNNDISIKEDLTQRELKSMKTINEKLAAKMSEAK